VATEYLAAASEILSAMPTQFVGTLTLPDQPAWASAAAENPGVEMYCHAAEGGSVWQAGACNRSGQLAA